MGGTGLPPRIGKRASIFDVAAHAGVSISTVSRVLGGRRRCNLRPASGCWRRSGP
jgi:hypothetical protein